MKKARGLYKQLYDHLLRIINQCVLNPNFSVKDYGNVVVSFARKFIKEENFKSKNEDILGNWKGKNIQNDNNNINYSDNNIHKNYKNTTSFSIPTKTQNSPDDIVEIDIPFKNIEKWKLLFKFLINQES